MSEEKSEDTKSPLVRRGPRPFAGPASSAPAARPFLRPATTAQRQTAAPFAPAIRRSAAPIASPVPAPATVAAVPMMPATVPAVTPPTPAQAPEPIVAPRALDTMPTMPDADEMATPDAFAAFDTVWASTEPAPMAGIEPPTMPSLLDVQSLGSELDGPESWAHEMTSAAEAIAEGGESATTAGPPAESRAVTPSLGIPPWLADDAESAPSAPAASAAFPPPVTDDPSPGADTWCPVEADASYSTADWSDLAAIPSAEAVIASVTERPADSQSLGGGPATVPDDWSSLPVPEPPATSRFELVEAANTDPVLDFPDARTLHGQRVCAALHRLADRVRSGEIDISSIAPEANDAAVLASVLAALLGGSSSR